MGVYVVDDAPTDETPQLMAQWYGANPKVHYLRLSENSGPAYARMIGVQAAQTEWIAFLDSDDVWAPNHLENASRIIAENPHVRLICAQRAHIIKGGKVILDKVIEAGYISEVLFKRIIFSFLSNHCCTILRPRLS
jgi:glycosyltransferase involved in cell wall biosynthesis